MKNGDTSACPIQAQPFLDESGLPRDPFSGYGWMVEPQPGLTKRELFAAMAMQGLAANPSPQVSSWNAEQTARCAAAFADALLARLEPKPLTPAQQAQEAQNRG